MMLFSISRHCVTWYTFRHGRHISIVTRTNTGRIFSQGSSYIKLLVDANASRLRRNQNIEELVSQTHIFDLELLMEMRLNLVKHSLNIYRQ